MAWLIAAYSLTMLPLAFWWCCCTSPCGNACRQTPPAGDVTITISGITNGVCSSCSQLNGTWVLSHLYPDSPCQWNIAAQSLTCVPDGSFHYNVTIQKITGLGTTVEIEAVTNQLTGIEWQWRHFVGTSPRDCSAIGTFSPATRTELHYQCEFSAATITVAMP